MKNPYFEDIAQWMTENNIALTKLDAKFTWIFKKLNKQDTPSSRLIAQHYVPNLFNLTIEKIREEIGENPIYLIADETSDKLNRYVLNILVGRLDGTYCKPMLLMVKFLENANSESVETANY